MIVFFFSLLFASLAAALMTIRPAASTVAALPAIDISAQACLANGKLPFIDMWYCYKYVLLLFRLVFVRYFLPSLIVQILM